MDGKGGKVPSQEFLDDVIDTIFGQNFKHQYLPHYLIFFGKKLET